jgi:hypothetical protein
MVQWLKALFTVEAWQLKRLPAIDQLFIYLWRFFVMGYALKWALFMILGDNIPFFWSHTSNYLASSHPEGLFWLCSIFLGLCGLFLTATVTAIVVITFTLKQLNVLDETIQFIAVLFAVLIMLAFNGIQRLTRSK